MNITDDSENIINSIRELCKNNDGTVYDITKLDDLVPQNQKKMLNGILKENYYSRLLAFLKNACELKGDNKNASILYADMELLAISEGEKKDLRRIIERACQCIINQNPNLVKYEDLVILEDKINIEINERILPTRS